MPSILDQFMYRPQIVTRPQAVPSPQMVAEHISGSVLSAWNIQTSYYDNWWNWFDGANLEVEDRKDVLKFPVGANPIQWICKRHGFGLYGEYPDNATSLVSFGFKNDDGKVDDTCKKAASIVSKVWSESNGAALQLENAILSQILGGHIYRLLWQPWNKNLTYGLRVSKVIPDYFLPVWSSDDQWHHDEIYILYYITGNDAEMYYGVDCNKAPYVLYMEHWTEGEYKITVDGKVPTKIRGVKNLEGGFAGENQFGIVPVVYTPHVSRAGRDYGMSHIPSLIRMTQEYNSRLADRGDAVRNASDDVLVAKNVNGPIKILQLGESRYYYDLGKQAPGNSAEPDAKYLEPNGVKAAAIGKEYTDDIWELMCRDSDTPGVMWGESHISQRAALSMDALASSYLKHARAERIQNRIGMGIINRYMLQMIRTWQMEKDGTSDVTEEMLHLEPTMRWSKLLPRNKMDLVQEMVQRKTVGLVSTRNGVEQLAEGENIDEEMELINEDASKAMELEQQKLKFQMSIKTRQQNSQAKLSARDPEKKQANPAQEKVS